MKIAFYCSEPEPANSANYLRLGVSGTVSALILAARGLADRGHEVTILNASKDGWFGGVRHLETRTPEAVRRRLREIDRPDVFIANGWAARIFLDHDIQAARRVYWVHNFIDQAPYVDAIRRGRLDYVFCISRNQLGVWWRSPVFHRVGQIYNAVDLETIARYRTNGPRERKILFLGAPRESKGFHDALRIFDRFAERHPGYGFHVVGSASLHSTAGELSANGIFEKDYEERRLRPLLLDPGGNPRTDVILHGTIPREEVLRHLATSAVALQNPSWDSEPEVHSISAMEAQAMGVPVVTAFRGGQPEVIRDGETGILLKHAHPEAGVTALERILGNPALARRMSEAAIRRIGERFSIATAAGAWERHLSTVIAGRRFHSNLAKTVAIKVRHKLRH